MLNNKNKAEEETLVVPDLFFVLCLLTYYVFCITTVYVWNVTAALLTFITSEQLLEISQATKLSCTS